MEQIYSGNTGTFSFLEVETKGEKEYYISGYISTKAIDTFNDLVTDECMSDMLEQINSGSIKIDFEHETIHNENLDINPVARIVEAKKDEKGIWVKAMINSANKRFSEMWGSIKNGFLDSFSIAFKPIETATRYIQGKAVRLLNKLKLVNIGLTGTPVNSECKLDNIIVKAISEMESEINLDDLSDEELESLEVKHKYIKRTGSPGNYEYEYEEGTQEGSKKKQTGTNELTKQERELAESDAVDLIIMQGLSTEEATEKIIKLNPKISKEQAEELAKAIEKEKEKAEKDLSEEQQNEKKEEFKLLAKEQAKQKQKDELPTADELPEIDPYKKGKELLENTGEDYEVFKNYYADPKNYKPKTFYHYSTQEDMTPEKLLAGKGRAQTELTGDGLYVGRDPKALERFYGINNELEGTKGKIVKFEGEPKFIDLTDDGALKNTVKLAKEKYPNSKEPIVDYIKDKGYDGMRYFDPVATGEEFVLYNVEPFQKKEIEKKSLEEGESHSTEQSDDNKQMAEEENQVANEANEVKTLETSETKEVKTDNANLEKELEEKNKELAEVKAKMVELEKQLAKPEFKALQDTPITKLKENNVTPLGLIG